jgi:hypothetical protein
MAAAGAPDAGPLLLPDAPVFRPTLDEFAHPQRYLERIAADQAVQAAGIAVIVPPLDALVPAGLVRARRGARRAPRAPDCQRSVFPAKNAGVFSLIACGGGGAHGGGARAGAPATR